MKKKAPFNQNAAIRGAIRRIFSRSPVVREVLFEGRREVPRYNKDGSRAKKDSVQYQCQVCDEFVSSTKIAVDHKIPVISVEEGFQDWNIFVARLFCQKENLQRICDPCHQEKTNEERFQRQLKKDQELLELLKFFKNKDDIKLHVKKFTKKKLEKYPKEFQDDVAKLKALLKE
jgi:5-methylcytosine-specific restriction endonuclease McrA